MKILVANDDGIQADGLWVLVDALRQVSEVVVVAPDREQSAVGTSVTLHHPLRMKKIESRIVRGIETYSVEGTPADSVILGLKLVAPGGVDLVISGINEGLNMGSDVFISGTVGAAFQGNFYETPAIAISTAISDSKTRFDVAATVAKLLVMNIQQKGLHPKSLLNVNVPNIPLDQIQGVELTRLAGRKYQDEIKKGHDGKRDYYWIVRGESIWKETKGTDIWAIRQNRVSITPLLGNITNSSLFHPLQELCSSLSRELRPAGC
ncbi:MAG: 5'/3'-nucleotidase SurE [Dehalococcoidia bacterium]|nr:5'/3'-nucleotidase SurE [Dehalococcoidia bacterium]